MVELILFYLLGGLAVLFGVLTIAFKNPLYSAVALIWNLICVAGIFTLHGAHFLAVAQVLVYAGAILVLFVFVIMLLNLRKDELGESKKRVYKVVGSLLVILLVVAIGGLMIVNSGVELPAAHAADYGNIEAIGRLLFGQYLLPFEVVSVILFAAILGAVAIAKKELW